MKNFKYISLITVFLASIFFLNGCKSKKTVAMGGQLEKKTHTLVIDDALKTQIEYTTISTKGNIELKIGSSSNKVTTHFKIVKDRAIQASVRPFLGYEAFLITITPDSIVMIDRTKRQYLLEDFSNSEFMKNFDFNFYNLQALLTNRIFVPGVKEMSKPNYDLFTVNSAEDVYLLQTKDKGDLLYNFAIDASDHVVSTLIYNENKNVTLQWSYSDFIQDEGKLYPTTMLANVDIAKKRLDIGISYKKLDFDKKLDVEISVPSNYTKVSFTELLGSYIKKK